MNLIFPAYGGGNAGSQSQDGFGGATSLAEQLQAEAGAGDGGGGALPAFVETFNGAYDNDWTEQFYASLNSWQDGAYRRYESDQSFRITGAEINGSLEGGSDDDLHPSNFQAWVRYRRNTTNTNAVPYFHFWQTEQSAVSATEKMAFKVQLDLNSLRITHHGASSGSVIAGTSSPTGEAAGTDIWFYVRCWLNNDGERHVEAYVVSDVDEVPNFGVDTPNVDCTITFAEEKDLESCKCPNDLGGPTGSGGDPRFYFLAGGYSGNAGTFYVDWNHLKIEALPSANKPDDTLPSTPSGQTFYDPMGGNAYLDSGDQTIDGSWVESPGNGANAVQVRTGLYYGDYSGFDEAGRKYDATFHGAAPSVDQWVQFDMYLSSTLYYPMLKLFMEDASGDNDPFTNDNDSILLQLRDGASYLRSIEAGVRTIEDGPSTYTPVLNQWVTFRVEVTHSGGTSTFVVKQNGSSDLTLTMPTANLPANLGRRFGMYFEKANSGPRRCIVRRVRAGTL